MAHTLNKISSQENGISFNPLSAVYDYNGFISRLNHNYWEWNDC